MRAVMKSCGLSLALAAAIAATPGLGAAQSAPASWSDRRGRWDDWKAGAFPTSTAHYEALKAAAKGGARLTWRTLPDWRGLWTAADSPPGAALGWGAPGLALGWGTPRYRYTEAQGLQTLPPAIPGAPPLPPDTPRPERPVLTAKAEQALIESLKQGALAWDYIYDCLPAGFPRWYTEPYLREFIPTPDQTWMINEYESEVRRIYTDGRGHVPADESYPVWEGDSIGFWDGDTLVIHTVGVKEGTWNKGQPPYSDKTETVEVVRKNAQGMIEARITVYDPETLQKPWRVIFGSHKVDLAKTPHMRINQFSCRENNNFVAAATGGITAILPGDPGYDDPKTLGREPDRR